MRSIRSRLLLWTVCGMAVLLAIFAAVVYEAGRRSLLAGFDEGLVTTARTICGFVEQSKEEIKIEIDSRQVPEFERTDRPEYFQMWREDGSTLMRSQLMTGPDLERIESPANRPVFQRVRLPDGRIGRAVGFSFVPKPDEDAKEPVPNQKIALVVARDTKVLDAEIGYLRWLLVAATGGTLLLAWIVGGVVVRQGLRPFDRLAAKIAAIQHDTLSSQVPVERMPAEMAPVVERLNDLLRRLGEAFHRERAFSADVAHELRTPLAGMRCTLEVALTRPRANEDYRQAMVECLEIIRRTQTMVDNLLALASLEHTKAPTLTDSVCLGDLVDSSLQAIAQTAEMRGLTIEKHVPESLGIATDRESLQRILGNLLENAAEYANAGGRIIISASEIDHGVEILVSNTGCNLSEEDMQHVFERFWRGDKSRSNTGVHCGLGLALVQRIAIALGGSVTASVADGLFTVRVIFHTG
jgi:two-component system, OmpR family, heavy metal sensor histidine kinase CusS